jgi:hypothetical protein
MKAEKERMYEDVKFLTELRPYRNYQNKESLKKVCEHIKRVFLDARFTVSEQKWMVGHEEFTNIIGIYQPNKTNRLVVGAHYDVCGDQPGADDNASAVAGLLETARLIGQQQPQTDYAIELVAFCLEEPPFFGTKNMGSYIHAQSLYEADAEVLGMICYEMIGYFSDQPNSQPYPNSELSKIYPSTANFITVVGIQDYANLNNQVQKLMASNSAIDVQLISFPSDNQLAGMSDQRNYWYFGYQALMINDTSFLRNPNYHLKSDTIETLDFIKMAEVINGAYHAIVKLSS